MSVVGKMIEPLRRMYLRTVTWLARRKLVKQLQAEALDEFLELLLRVIGLTLRLDAGYRKNVEGFQGRYVFRTSEGAVAVSAVFAGGALAVGEDEIPDTDVTVTFRNPSSLCEFLFSPDPDVFAFILDNKVDYEGNLNYLLKFGYLAKRLRLKLAA